MLGYLAQQVLSLFITLALVLTLVFVGMRVLPGDPASVRAGLEASPAQVEAIRRSLGLDRPLLQQYRDYWRALLQGDLGLSIRERRPVVQILLERLPVTLSLALTAFGLATLLGLGLGLLAGLRTHSSVDRLVLGYTTFGLSLPEFWLGFLLILFFAVSLPWFPLLGYPAEGGLGLRLWYLALPAATLAIPRAAQLARLTRAQLREELSSDYVRTAHAKGLRRPAVGRHVAANALPGLIPLVAVDLGSLLTGTIVVEQVFGLPGLGLALLGSIAARDYPVVQGVTIFAVVVFIGINWLADLLQGLADPRLRYQ